MDDLFQVPEPHRETGAREHHRKVVLPQTPDQVEGLSLRTLSRQSQRVGGHPFLDRIPHLRRRAEEAIGGDRSADALMWAAEVVGLDEKADPPLAVVEVREDGPRQEFFPERLPETLDLSERLRVMGTALDVADALTAQLGLEVGVTAPRDILPPLVGQDLARRPVLRDASRERFQHQRRALVVRHHQ